MSGQELSQDLSENQEIARQETVADSKTGDNKTTDSKAPKVVDLKLKDESKVVCPEMAYFCFDTLIALLTGKRFPKPTFTNKPFPLFVTWTIGKEKILRGCIGTFSALNLHDGLRKFALTSAMEDHRFPPITEEEVPNLNVSVSLLRHFEQGSDYLDWEIGKHGIDIKFRLENGQLGSATFLPEVMVEHGMTKVQAIDKLFRKGGYKGVITQELRESVKLTRYQSEKLTVSYEDYIEHSSRDSKN